MSNIDLKKGEKTITSADATKEEALEGIPSLQKRSKFKKKRTKQSNSHVMKQEDINEEIKIIKKQKVKEEEKEKVAQPIKVVKPKKKKSSLTSSQASSNEVQKALSLHTDVNTEINKIKTYKNGFQVEILKGNNINTRVIKGSNVIISYEGRLQNDIIFDSKRNFNFQVIKFYYD